MADRRGCPSEGQVGTQGMREVITGRRSTLSKLWVCFWVCKKENGALGPVFPQYLAGGRLANHCLQPAWVLDSLIRNNQRTPKNTPCDTWITKPTNRSAIGAKQAARVFFHIVTTVQHISPRGSFFRGEALSNRNTPTPCQIA